jgi:hypothetical protein
MSLVIIANKPTNQEQFGRFIVELNGVIASHNANIESEEGAANKAAKVEISDFSSKAKSLLEADNLSGLLTHILTIDNVIINDSRFAVSSFYILSLLASKITDNAQQLKSVKELINSIVSKKLETSGIKFKLLVSLFNGFGNEKEIRYEIFSAILSLADELNKPNILLTHLNNIDEYVSDWNLPKDKQTKLLKLAAKLINKCDDKLYKEKYGFYSKYLRLLNNIFDEQVLKENVEDIKTVLKTALNHFPYEIDISTFLDLKPVQEIAKVDKDLYELFVTAVEGNLEGFEKWKQGHASYLATNKINEERVLDRVRLKSVFQLVQKNKVLKLKDIEKLLKLSEDEVEFWIIKVHQEGHIRGKIDQLEGTLYIDGIIDDSFKSSEWKDLEKNLGEFRKNYEGYIEKLKNEKSK